MPTEAAKLRKCRFCRHPGVAVFALDAGCFAAPEDREQSLCVHHVWRAMPFGSMDLKTVLMPEVWAEARRVLMGAEEGEADGVRRSGREGRDR